jgi:hypothetical protein
MPKRPKVEIVYQPRSEWPEEIVAAFHELHFKNGTFNPKCPHCIAKREGRTGPVEARREELRPCLAWKKWGISKFPLDFNGRK